MTTSAAATIPAGLDITDTTVDLLVIGSGTGLAAALSGHEAGLNVLVVEKASDVGGSTARSGGALWLPTTPLLTDKGTADTADRASTYLDAVVHDTAPAATAARARRPPASSGALSRWRPGPPGASWAP